MNIIFVDIDGPLLPRKMHLFRENRSNKPKAIPKFDEFAIKAFNLWAKYGAAKIVFSTYWSCHFTAEELKQIMHTNGLGFEYHGDILTPKKMSSTRHNEILWWLENHNDEIDNWIAVDDDTSCKYIQEIIDGDCDTAITKPGRWIPVDFDNGISWKNFCDGCVGLGIDVNEVLNNEFTQSFDDETHHTLW